MPGPQLEEPSRAYQPRTRTGNWAWARGHRPRAWSYWKGAAQRARASGSVPLGTAATTWSWKVGRASWNQRRSRAGFTGHRSLRERCYYRINLTPQVFPFRHNTRQCSVVLKPSSESVKLKAAVWCVDEWSMAPSRWQFSTEQGWQPRTPSTWSSASWLISMRSRARRSCIGTSPKWVWIKKLRGGNRRKFRASSSLWKSDPLTV